jgi:hypothetical protein
MQTLSVPKPFREWEAGVSIFEILQARSLVDIAVLIAARSNLGRV